MDLSSSAFKDKGEIPVKYTMPKAGGQNISLPLQWSAAPEKTKSFALSIVDPHPVANNWVHWLVVDIPPEVTSLKEGASVNNMPEGARELKNTFGKTGYGGPQPPSGSGEHPYVVTLYALNTPQLDIDQGADLSDFKKAVEDNILATAELTGMFAVP